MPAQCDEAQTPQPVWAPDSMQPSWRYALDVRADILPCCNPSSATNRLGVVLPICAIKTHKVWGMK